MFSFGGSIFCVLLTLHMSACGLETAEYDRDGVICSQGLVDCSMTDVMLLMATKNTADVQTLQPKFKLCCKAGKMCTLCLVIDAELYIQLQKDRIDEGSAGSDEEDYSEETGSVTVCYQPPSSIPSCKQVEFTVNHSAGSHQNLTKVSMVITEPGGFPFSSGWLIYPYQSTKQTQEVVAPSLGEVCSKKLQKRVPNCQVPTVSSVINQEKNQVELQFEGSSNKSVPSVCVQYEENGICQNWNKKTIPLRSVTPCMCLQVWEEDGQMSKRSLLCPFNKTDYLHVLQKNIWHNVLVSVSRGRMRDFGTILSWNLSAPCRLEGEVRLNDKENSRQQLINGTWRQNSKGHWAITGVFDSIDLQPLPCVKVRVKGAEHELGPFCVDTPNRLRWTLLVVGVLMLVCLTVLMFYVLHGFVKRWVWSCHHGGFVKIGRKGHVVLLSPPDEDSGVSESVCQLGSLLCNQGFSVSVDQWSRKEQCDMGPLPWLHSQLLKLKSVGGRVLLILTQKTLERTEEWTRWSKDVIKMESKERPLLQFPSPYSDLFTASLLFIHADKLQGRAGERFVLVKFDSHTAKSNSRDRSLPELLHGLSLFHFPSQTQSLLAELTVVETERESARRTWTGWKWRTMHGPRV
ncbi:uncharacterized protein LOC114436404 isoform X2 [Parambassis ranga]|uniref:Uncharacterized protein LOC114436404 isoform X2 n=1 Tax=Parambassis ranga TaxID=210632 RepID=A0A6P7I3C7_9TELE|nr:uncharacterized protein LOC114436404 isoform X2 [Parambassis ranga]